jgi:hypothetical protein
MAERLTATIDGRMRRSPAGKRADHRQQAQYQGNTAGSGKEPTT